MKVIAYSILEHRNEKNKCGWPRKCLRDFDDKFQSAEFSSYRVLDDMRHHDFGISVSPLQQ